MQEIDGTYVLSFVYVCVYLKMLSLIFVENSKFLGFRYWKDNDLGVILIFDPAGYIAGIQAGVSIYAIFLLTCTPYA